ncbi:MAG TPA: T9SS type A sorting domain-containing protein, partial [Flavobacterium sp.]|nr:T9SS type A sorting domain-containing protein [Flavobacterium sp.]
ADEGQVTAVQTTAGASVVVNSYCTFTPGGDYNTITGAVRFDGNNNGCDINDVTAPFIKVNITEGVNTGATFTTANSLYSFYTGAGNFTVTPNLENPTFFTVSPASAAVNFPNVNNNVSTQNFCLSANGVHRDVEVAIAPITLARPGFDAQYEIVYKNKGNQTQNGSVTFNYNDNVLNFVSATPVPSSQATGLLTFNYTNLLPFENRIAKVTVHVNAPTDTPAVNAGYVLDFTTAITLNGTDETPADNTMNYHQTVVSSLDPNVKTCVEGNVVSPSEIGKYLHYVINFENTGTQAAQNIVVVDMIDISKFDINSLRVMNSSHPVDIRVTGNKAEFIFRDINLAIGGHGNILLKIKTLNSLTTGAVVSNKADIFFDYNFPVATNIANTTFQALGVNEHEFDNSITVYPNPAHDILNVKGQNNIKSIQLFDVQGRILQTNLVNENTATIDISGKQSGIYFLKITSDKGIKVEKIVKN